MDIKKYEKESFSVIGKEGSTEDGGGFISRLWAESTMHLNEVAGLAKKGDSGTIVGVWGLMSDFSRSFKPWDDGFTRGLYLAGVEVINESEAPADWVKWTVPSFEYIYAKVEDTYQNTFSAILTYIENHDLSLAGAIFDYTCLEENGQQYLFAPIKRL